MLLANALRNVEVVHISTYVPVEVIGVTLFPEESRDGYIFVSLPHPDRLCAGVDGAHDRCIAAQRGAVIISEIPQAERLGDAVVWVQVESIVQATEQIFANFYQHPDNSINLFGVTGTNGKTTTSYMLREILQNQNRKCGIISTISCQFADVTLPMDFTTLAPGRLHLLANQMQKAGMTDCVMEVTSHMLAMDRHVASRYAVSGFTNLTRDHLDFHETMENYFSAKRKLFEVSDSACFNLDDAYSKNVEAHFKKPKVTISLTDKRATFYASKFNVCDTSSIRVELIAEGQRRDLHLALVGQHNVSNALMALGMAYLGGVDLDLAIGSLESLGTPPGRLEKVAENPLVFVDYAHTPDGLKNLLDSLRPHVRGRLVCVFGCGGERDRGKRYLMGKVADEYADWLVVTSDNPRSEDPQAIIEEVASGIQKSKHHALIEDRERAISEAVSLLHPEDCLVIAGKGHECFQIIGNEKKPFSDVAVASKYLKQHVQNSNKMRTNYE